MNDIYIRIVLAVSEYNLGDISPILNKIDADLNNGVQSIYIIASGSKISYAESIADQSYIKNFDRLEKPRYAQYRRKGKKLYGTAAVCYELINVSPYNIDPSDTR